MAIDRFIPELWSTRLIRHLDKALVYGQPGVINRNYEGEIQSAGDTVHINQVADLTVGTYTKGTPISYESADQDLQADLVIDQSKYFAVEVEDIDRVQANVNLLDESVARGAYKLADTVDQFVAAKQSVVVAAGNVIQGAGVALTLASAAAAYDALVDLGVLLDEQNVPSMGRFAIIPPWFHGLIRKDDRFVGFGTGENQSALKNGVVGEAAGFTLAKSNNVPNTANDDYRILAGSNQGITLATQLTETEALRSPDQFSDRVRSLLVYGGVVVNPEELAVLRVDRP